MAALAYMDEAVPLTPPGAGRRWLLAPRVLAKLLQLAEIGDDDRVLDVGCASGYSAAVLAGMAQKRRRPRKQHQARRRGAARTLPPSRSTTLSVVVGELTAGWVDKAPYDAIVLQGAVPTAPEALFDQLKDGGRLVAVVIEDGLGKATIWRRLGRSVDAWTAFDAAAPDTAGLRACTRICALRTGLHNSAHDCLRPL